MSFTLFAFPSVMYHSLFIADPAATEARATLSRLSSRDEYNQIEMKRVHLINLENRPIAERGGFFTIFSSKAVRSSPIREESSESHSHLRKPFA